MSKKLPRIIILILTIIVSLWVSRILIISGVHNGISALEQVKQFGISFSFLIKSLHLLINPSVDGFINLSISLFPISFLSSVIAIPSGLLLLISSIAILRSKKWGLKATVLAANCCYFVYAINMLLSGLRFNTETIILGYLPVIYLSFIPFLRPLRERVGLGASTIREKTEAIALPVLIFVFSGIIYVNTVNVIISKETLASKLKSGSEIEELFKNAKYPACEWIDQWSFCIPKGLIKQKPIPKDKDSEDNTDAALWKNNNNQYVFLSMPAVTEKITLPPSKNKNYELEKEISNAGFWDGLAALGYKDFSINRNSKNEIYDLVRPTIKTIVYIAHTQKKNNWYVNANIYPLNSKSMNYKSSNKSLEIALAPLIMTLNEYEKRINKKTN